MSRPKIQLSTKYQIRLLDHSDKLWNSFCNDIDELRDKGITLEALADAAGVSRWSIYRLLQNKNSNSQRYFAIFSIVNQMKADYAKLPARKKRRKNKKNSLRGAEVRVVRGS